MSCGVGGRCGSEPALLWLWRRPTAVAPVQPLAWEFPYAARWGPKRQKKKGKKRKKNPLTLHLQPHDTPNLPYPALLFLFGLGQIILGTVHIYLL